MSNRLQAGLERPFPLRRIFRRRIGPAVVLILVVMVVVGSLAEIRTARDVYVNLAQSRAEVIAAAVASEVPADWRRLVDQPLRVLTDDAALERLRQAFQEVLRDSRIAKVKVYEPGGRLVLGGRPGDVGKLETAPQLRDSFDNAHPVAVRTTDSGAAVYEFYVPVAGEDGSVRLVFEIYEPAGFLDKVLWMNALPAIALPAVLLGGLLLWLAGVVRRAQDDIDHRTQALVGLRQRLERFVSGSAKGAARGAGDGAALPSRLVDMTLFYSDVVDFTGYSETHPPQRVVDYLNRLMTIQIEELHRCGGDIDKMIGDAVLACFEGPDRAERAVAAARAIQRRLEGEPDLPRPIRIGLHDGHVISGAIGPDERQDFTVIGDSVNVAARLCAAAGPGEVLADQRTLARAGHPEDFGPVEEIAVKNRQERLAIRRWRMAAAPASAPAR